MKVVAALALVYAGLAAAQLNGLPDCAVSLPAPGSWMDWNAF
jgi:hypothetical protein